MFKNYSIKILYQHHLQLTKIFVTVQNKYLAHIQQGAASSREWGSGKHGSSDRGSSQLGYSEHISSERSSNEQGSSDGPAETNTVLEEEFGFYTLLCNLFLYSYYKIGRTIG